MDQTKLVQDMVSAIDVELHACVDDVLSSFPLEYVAMLRYQMGWEGEGSGKGAQGKRIRPLLVLLTCHACGGDWRQALPAAAAVELLHNFSLIHDDIQDRDETRRGRPTLWKKWGVAQAINAGDAMFTLAQRAMLRLSSHFSADTVILAVQILLQTCQELTRGQHLDMAFEEMQIVSLELYEEMVCGKTGSLLAACLRLAALLANKPTQILDTLSDFGYAIGSAFQIQDDWLGIWGDCSMTGKSVTGDLIEGKKTYPVLLGLHRKDKFYHKWAATKQITPHDVPDLVRHLQSEGVEFETRQRFENLYQTAFELLDEARLDADKVQPLRVTVQGLFDRNK